MVWSKSRRGVSTKEANDLAGEGVIVHEQQPWHLQFNLPAGSGRAHHFPSPFSVHSELQCAWKGFPQRVRGSKPTSSSPPIGVVACKGEVRVGS